MLDCPKVEIVADSGYSAESNMIRMIKNSYPLIMHIPTDTKWTRICSHLLQLAKKAEEDIKFRMQLKTIISLYQKNTVFTWD